MARSSVTISTWNINSVRLRIDHVERFLGEVGPDVLCLQETKCPNDKFPRAAFEAFGYRHIAVNGQRGYHGVATVSKIAFDGVSIRSFCGKGDARHLATTLDRGCGVTGLRIHNFYVPAGGDVPDPAVNDKFGHKLDFLDEMAAWFAAAGHGDAAHQLVVGDLNVAPLENDVWSHRQLLKVVSHTPIEVEKLGRAQAAAGWVDVIRTHIPGEQKLFTWWSYRARDWRVSNRGRRLDHVWASPALSGCASEISILDSARDWPQPSDHVPVTVRLAFQTEDRAPS